MNNNKVAIILCIKDNFEYLEEQLDSIFAQDYKNFDVFLSDDSLTNKVNHILKKYRVTYLEGPNKGFAVNFISTLINIPDDYSFYAFADQDDIWLENKLSYGIDILLKQNVNNPNLFCGRTVLVNHYGKKIGMSPLFKRSPSFRNALVQSIAGGNTMIFNSKTKDLLKQVDLSKTVVSHDWITYLFVSAVGGKVIYEQEPLVKYRIHDKNLVGSNIGFKAFFKRFNILYNGNWMKWINANIEQLKNIVLTDNKYHLEIFIKMRESKNLLKRLNYLFRHKFYRQTLMGEIALFMMVLMRKL